MKTIIPTLPSRYINCTAFDAGGMSTIFKCMDSFLERDVIIKILQPGSAPKRILAEINALQQIRSKHVVQIFERLQLPNGDIAIIEEFIDGKTLNNQIPEEHYFKIIYQLAAALHEIHEHEIIHRDIKPDNFKIDNEGVLKVFDFGLAKSTMDAKTIGFNGTFVFAAPELYSDKTVSFTKKIDVYAFGITCIYFLLGEKEFFNRIKSFTMPPFKLDFSFSEKNFLSISNPELCTLLARSISKNPDERPEMEEIFNELRKKLIFGKHRGIMVNGTNSYVLDQVGKRITLSYRDLGSCKMFYDGNDFYIEEPIGEIYVNATHIKSTFKIPSSCLITIGSDQRSSSERAFVPFDSANPEVVL